MESQVRYRYSKVRLTVLAATLILLLAALAYGGRWLYGQFNPVVRYEAGGLLAKVGSLVDLPHGEEPTIATITDLAPLKDEAFFADAEVGDKVLIYGTAKKAILYRPKEDRVIIIAPLN